MNKKEQGWRYNVGKIKWSLVDFPSLEPMVKVLEYGLHKYSLYEDDEGNQFKGSEIPIKDAGKYKVISSGKGNWKKGMPISEVMESLERHWIALLDGEELDNESGLPHIGHLMCNAMFISHIMKNKPEFNDLKNK